MESFSLNIKFIGFIEKHNSKVYESRKLSDLIGEKKKPKKRIEIITYLEKGEIVISWMGYFEDNETGDILSPDCYYTDGNYIWPSYLIYYLKKYPNFKLEKQFIDYLEKSNFLFPSVSKNKIKLLESNFSKILVSNAPLRRR